MKCLEDTCPLDALENSNFCSKHQWTSSIPRLIDGGDPPSGGGDEGPSDESPGDDFGRGMPGDPPTGSG